MVSGIGNPNLIPDEPATVEPAPTPAEKPGWQSTEFWLTLIAMIVGALLSSGAVAEGTTLYQAITFAAVVLTALGYQVSTTIRKSAAAKAQVAYYHAETARLNFSRERLRKITLE